MDVPAASIILVRMIDGAKIQPPQTLKPTNLLEWVKRQQSKVPKVVSCCEAEPTRPWLHGKLTS